MLAAARPCAKARGASHSADDLAAVAAALNTRPRKTLGWRTPAEVLDEYVTMAA